MVKDYGTCQYSSPFTSQEVMFIFIDEAWVSVHALLLGQHRIDSISNWHPNILMRSSVFICIVEASQRPIDEQRIAS